MTIKSRFLLALLAASGLQAAPLTSTTAVHPRPDASSPAIAVLNAGSEPKAALGAALPLPSGWSAVELSGPVEAYIANKDLTKELEVKPGAAFRTQPKADAPVITTMEPGDQFEISAYHGKWTKVKLNKKIVGYIQGWSGGSAGSIASVNRTAPAASTAPASTPTPATSPAARPTPAAAPSQAPMAPAAVAGGGAGRPVQMVNLGDGGSASLPRLFQGKFVSTKVLLRPRRPYDFQLNDSAGERYAYLDISRLLQTEQIEKYIDHTVAVYGAAKPIPGTKDIVIEVESLQLK